LLLVTGGAGFIGANFILEWFKAENSPLLNLDKLTYAGNPENLVALRDNPDYTFVRGDIGDRPLIADLFSRYRPRAVINFAAESHVDRSISGPEDFISTNVVGTFHLLDEARRYWQDLDAPARDAFRFLHISTDEVYGSLTPTAPPFTEASPFQPNSPYAASKAASDHLVRAYQHTYGLPTLTTNCSNNYGPLQFPEKLIPLIIGNAVAGKPLPIYGDGQNVRDWLYVTDHCEAIRRVLAKGRVGETYNIGGWNELDNLAVVRTVCRILDEVLPDSPHRPHESLITFVKDRPGHDRRYAINAEKIERELGWKPREDFASGIRKTVQWYLDNQAWTDRVTRGEYQQWISAQYGKKEAT